MEIGYFDDHQPGKEQTSNYMDSHSEEIQLLLLRELLDAQGNDRSCPQAALTIGLPKSMFTFHTEGALA